MLANSAAKLMLDHSTPQLYAMLGRPYTPTNLRDQFLSGHFSLQGKDLCAVALPAAWTLLNFALAILMIIGLLRLCLRGHAWPALLMAGCFVYFVLATQYHGDERMRLPVLWVEAIAAGWAFAPRQKIHLFQQTPQAAPAAAQEPNGHDHRYHKRDAVN